MSAPAEALRALATLPCLGKTSARMLAEAGIESPEALKRIGAVEAYRRLRFTFGKRATASYLYALDIAVRGRHWSDLDAPRMARLRVLAREIQKQQAALVHTPRKRV